MDERTQYGQAVNDINVLRQRAAYKTGESRPDVLVEWEPGGIGLRLARKQFRLILPMVLHIERSL